MNLKKNSGFTQVDIIISIIIITVFISLIAGMFVNLASNNKEVKREVEAVNLAIEVIETLKRVDYNLLESNITTIDDLNRIADKEIDQKEGYIIEIDVKKYKDLEENHGRNLRDILKKVKVTVKYTIGKLDKNVELETLISAQ